MKKLLAIILVVFMAVSCCFVFTACNGADNTGNNSGSQEQGSQEQGSQEQGSQEQGSQEQGSQEQGSQEQDVSKNGPLTTEKLEEAIAKASDTSAIYEYTDLIDLERILSSDFNYTVNFNNSMIILDGTDFGSVINSTLKVDGNKIEIDAESTVSNTTITTRNICEIKDDEFNLYTKEGNGVFSKTTIPLDETGREELLFLLAAFDMSVEESDADVPEGISIDDMTYSDGKYTCESFVVTDSFTGMSIEYKDLEIALNEKSNPETFKFKANMSIGGSEGLGNMFMDCTMVFLYDEKDEITGSGIYYSMTIGEIAYTNSMIMSWKYENGKISELNEIMEGTMSVYNEKTGTIENTPFRSEMKVTVVYGKTNVSIPQETIWGPRI